MKLLACISPQKSYLFLLSTYQIPPFLRYVAEVHLVHGHLDVADGIVFREAVKVVHRHYQCFSTELHIGNLKMITTETDQYGLKADKPPHIIFYSVMFVKERQLLKSWIKEAL